MFTGLIEGIGKIKGIRRSGGDAVMMIVPPPHMAGFKIGESMAVNGVCLTVTRILEGGISADVSMETLSRTTLGELRASQEVNLERALRLSDRVGGHLVSGHVDGLGEISSKDQRAGSWRIKIRVNESISRHMIEKGSVAVDGISLTINTCEKDFFEVNIIPQTQMETTLLRKGMGDRVNIETDMIGKYVEKLLSVKGEARVSASGIDMDMLMKHGFDT